MIDQLLWIDCLVKMAAGLLFLAVPGPVISLFGLPKASSSFYPRLVGMLLLAIALALLIEGAGERHVGLGLAGAGAINLTVAAMLAIILTLARPRVSRRGRGLLWFMVGAATLFALIELIAY